MTTLGFGAKSSHVLLGFLVIGYSGSTLAAEIEFSRINACKEIPEVFSMLELSATKCRPPTGEIESILHNLATGSSAKLCFMDRPPTSSLSSFRCMAAATPTGRTMTCYRAAAIDVLNDYKANFSSSFSAKASAYIKDARNCHGSNGDASRIIETTFPPILRWVAQHDFGFNVQYGASKPGSALVSHGFARTSPEVSARGPAAIEYVVYSADMMKEPEARTALGNWRLLVNTAADVTGPLAKALKVQGVAAYGASFDIDIVRSPHASARHKKPSLPDELSDVVASMLEDEGFEELSDDELKRSSGKSRAEMVESVSKGGAFGARNLLNGQVPTFRLLMKTSGRTCTQGGSGAIAAYLFAFEGQAGVQVDFGSVSAMIVGLGACASAADSRRKYIRNLTEESKEVVLTELRGS